MALDLTPMVEELPRSIGHRDPLTLRHYIVEDSEDLMETANQENFFFDRFLFKKVVINKDGINSFVVDSWPFILRECTQILGCWGWLD